MTSCIMGVTALNQDTKTTELLCGTCCQKKPSKNQNIIKATGTGEGPLTSFCMLSLLTPLWSFPLFFVSCWSHHEQKQQFIMFFSFFFFFNYQQTVQKPHQQKCNLFWRLPLGRLESQDSTNTLTNVSCLP